MNDLNISWTVGDGERYAATAPSGVSQQPIRTLVEDAGCMIKDVPDRRGARVGPIFVVSNVDRAGLDVLFWFLLVEVGFSKTTYVKGCLSWQGFVTCRSPIVLVLLAMVGRVAAVTVGAGCVTAVLG